MCKAKKLKLHKSALSDLINRLVKFQLLSFTRFRFRFRAFPIFEPEQFLLKHPLTECQASKAAAILMLRCAKVYAPSVSAASLLLLKVDA